MSLQSVIHISHIILNHIVLGADNTTLIATTWIELISQNYQSKLPTQATALKKKQLSIPKAAQSRKCQCHLTLKSAAGFSSSDRENLLSNILVSMSRQCQKLQLLIDHMAVCLKNKFACASVCLCVLAGFLWQLQLASSISSSVRCHNYNEVLQQRVDFALFFFVFSMCLLHP